MPARAGGARQNPGQGTTGGETQSFGHQPHSEEEEADSAKQAGNE